MKKFYINYVNHSKVALKEATAIEGRTPIDALRKYYGNDYFVTKTFGTDGYDVMVQQEGIVFGERDEKGKPVKRNVGWDMPKHYYRVQEKSLFDKLYELKSGRK